MPEVRRDIAIIVPSVRESVRALERDLASQSITPAVLEVVRGVRPNGRARNEGVRRALAREPGLVTFVFVDDDVRIPDPDTLAKVLAPLDRDGRGTIGVSGAAKVLGASASRF